MIAADVLLASARGPHPTVHTLTERADGCLCVPAPTLSSVHVQASLCFSAQPPSQIASRVGADLPTPCKPWIRPVCTRAQPFGQQLLRVHVHASCKGMMLRPPERAAADVVGWMVLRSSVCVFHVCRHVCWCSLLFDKGGDVFVTGPEHSMFNGSSETRLNVCAH